MTRSRRTLVVTAALAASALIATLASRCAHGGDAEKPGSATSAGAEDPRAPAAATDPAIGAQPAAQPATAQNAPAPDAALQAAQPAPGDAITRALHATDARDRDLLADIERQTHAEPPAAVRELLALRRRGASRADLDRFIAERLQANLVVRVAAQRWARAVAPLPGDPPPPSTDIGFGHGGGVQRVKPIAPKPR